MSLRVSLYIDGFNFYYGLFRGHPLQCPANHKWLDPVMLGNLMCRQYGINGQVVRVHYCSAPSLPGLSDPNQATRQQHYLRALGGLPEVVVTLGLHMESPKMVRLPAPLGTTGSGTLVRAWVREEKGSDVNLASFLVRDAALNEFDTAFVLSNDSDLENAIRIAVQDFSKTVIVVSPHINGPSGKRARVTNKLQAAASKSYVLDHTLLGQCRMADPAQDATGRAVTCPSEWT